MLLRIPGRISGIFNIKPKMEENLEKESNHHSRIPNTNLSKENISAPIQQSIAEQSLYNRYHL